LYEHLYTLNEAGYSARELLEAIDEQLELIKKSGTLGEDGRLLAIARTHLETAILYLEKLEKRRSDTMDSGIPLIFLED
jgi:hypothetical protein